jgi:hypothetical protein
MKRTSARKRLALNAESIRKLTADILHDVHGAGSGSHQLGCSDSCTCPNTSVGGVCNTIIASDCKGCDSVTCDSIDVC